jgi:translation initiation factor 1
MTKAKAKPQPEGAPDAPFNNPFGRLAQTRDSLPKGIAPKAASVPEGPARAVVRLERKGRGGKEVTVVEQLGLRSVALEEWLKSLKQALGCGGAVEGDALVVQGDQRERVEAWLEMRGVKRISVG